MLLEVMRYLESLCRMLSSADSENCLTNPNVITERRFHIDKDVQEILKNLEAQDIVIDIIRDNIWLMKDKPDKANDESFVNFFKYCFLFLMKFCHKNETNQELLSKSISVFIQEQDFDVGQVGLLVEIYRDNSNLCKRNADQITDDFIKWILNMGRQSGFLDLFLITMKCNNDFLGNNQRKTLSLF